MEARASEFTNVKASAMRALENEFETLRLSLRIKQPSEAPEKEKEKGGGERAERTAKPAAAPKTQK